MAGGGIAAATGAIRNDEAGRFRATSQLTEKQRKFVRFYVTNGGHAAAAAEAAGYEHPRTAAWQIKESSRVMEAIKQEREKFIGGDLANAAASAIRDLITDDATPAGVRFQASKWALEAAGHVTNGKGEQAAEGDKPLNELTIDELQAFINGGQKALQDSREQQERTIDVTPSQTTDEPSSARDDPPPGGSESILD